MAERPEDIIAARMRLEQDVKRQELQAMADQLLVVIRKVIPFAVDNIKRHNYPSDPGTMSKRINMIDMWMGHHNDRKVAWGSRYSGFAIDADGNLYRERRRPYNPSIGSSVWWESYACSDELPADLDLVQNHVWSLMSNLNVLDTLATSLRSTLGRDHATGEDDGCLDCKLAREYRRPVKKIPPGYPTQEVDALLHPNEPRNTAKPKGRGFLGKLKTFLNS